MRVAAIYDIHGNLLALEAALAAIEATRADLIVVGGDIAWGPLPAECVDRLRALGPRCRYVRGDADRDVLDALLAPPDPDDETELVSRWCADQLSEEQRQFLRDQPPALSVEIDGLGPTLFCHGSPRSDCDRMTAGTSEERLAPMLAGVRERVVVCGHTHAQFDRLVDGLRIVNPGSIGLGFGEQGAHWALLGPDVDLRRTDYDYDAAVAHIRARRPPAEAKFIERVLDPPPAATAVERWG